MTELVGLGEDSTQVTVERAGRGRAGAGARPRAGAARRARRQPGERRHGRRLGGDRRHADGAGCSSRCAGDLVGDHGRGARAARRADSRCRWSACRRPSARPAASPSTWSAPARSPGARRAASSRPIRPTSATSSPATSRRRWSRSASRRSAGSEPRSLTVTVVALQRRRRCSSPTSRRRATALSSARTASCWFDARYAVRNNQRSFLAGRRCRRQSTLWSADVAGRPIRPGVARATRCCCRSKRGAPAKRRRPSSSSWCTCSAARRGPRRDAHASICRPSICRCRAPASTLHHSPRYRVEPQPGAFRVEHDPGPFAAALPPTGVAPPSGAMKHSGDRAGRRACRRWSIRSETRPAGTRWSGRCRLHVAFPAFGPSHLPGVRADGRKPVAPSVELHVSSGQGEAAHDHTDDRHTLTAASSSAMAHARRARSSRRRPGEAPGRVTLSLTEYNRLIDLAGRPPQTPTVGAGGRGAVARRPARARRPRHRARRFSLDGEVLRAGVASRHADHGRDAARGHALEGRPLPLIAEGNAHTALLPGPGPFALSARVRRAADVHAGPRVVRAAGAAGRDRPGDDRRAGRPGRRPSVGRASSRAHRRRRAGRSSRRR